MTTVMPRPFDLLQWAVNSAERAIVQAEGQSSIPEEAKGAIDNFVQEFKPGAMRDAMATEIRWMKDGRTFPGPIGGSQPVKYDEEEKFYLDISTRLQRTYSKFASALKSMSVDGVHDYQETERLKELTRTLKSGLDTLTAAVQELRESKTNNKPAYEIFNMIKNQVNEQANDTAFGPFGMLHKFGKDEAENFLEVLNYTVTDWDKKQEVVQTLFDTASSPYGNLVLNRAAADAFAAAYPIEGVDWSKAVDAFKDEHPIVALYAVVIDREMNNPNASVRDLEVLMNSGTAALSELRNEFITRGPRTVGGAEMPAFFSISSS